MSRAPNLTQEIADPFNQKPNTPPRSWVNEPDPIF